MQLALFLELLQSKHKVRIMEYKDYKLSLLYDDIIENITRDKQEEFKSFKVIYIRALSDRYLYIECREW